MSFNFISIESIVKSIETGDLSFIFQVGDIVSDTHVLPGATNVENLQIDVGFTDAGRIERLLSKVEKLNNFDK